MKVISKAYRVWVHSMIGEYPFFSPDDLDVVYASKDTEAKSHLLIDDAQNEDGEKATYIDIKCKRVPSMDKVRYNGEEYLRYQYERQLEKEKRNEKLRMLDPNEMYYVQSATGYVGNAVLWWAKGEAGYTCDIEKAAKYTKEDVLKLFLNGRDSDVIWNSKHVEQAVKKIVDSQYLDRTHSV